MREGCRRPLSRSVRGSEAPRDRVDGLVFADNVVDERLCWCRLCRGDHVFVGAMFLNAAAGVLRRCSPPLDAMLPSVAASSSSTSRPSWSTATPWRSHAATGVSSSLSADTSSARRPIPPVPRTAKVMSSMVSRIAVSRQTVPRYSWPCPRQCRRGRPPPHRHELSVPLGRSR